jgi:hypothetical protein
MSEVWPPDDGPTGSERGGRRRREALRSDPTSTPLAAEDVGAPVMVVDPDEGFFGIRRRGRWAERTVVS